MSERMVYLMRGLPSCGKSYTARRLAGRHGIVVETDEYFHLMVGSDPARYDYDEKLLPAARRWNFDRFQQAVLQGISPIVVDRGNGLNRESQRYAQFAIDHQYHVQLREPESKWWQEIRSLLVDKSTHLNQLNFWAERLAAENRATHRVPVSTIRSWMMSWNLHLTVEDILAFESTKMREMHRRANSD